MDKKYQAILDKLEEIATNKAEHDKKLDTIIDQTRQLQDDYAKVKADIEELRSDFDEMHDISKNLQLDMERKVDVEFFQHYKDEIDRKIDDLTNRSKRNNLVFWNVPEGDEKEKGCVQFIEDFLENHMKISDVSEILIQKAHRSPLSFNPQKQQLSGSQSKKPSPRPIHVRFVNEADKDYILRRAPSILKNNPYGLKRASIIITDDVSEKVRMDRKILREKELPAILKLPGVKVAFVAFMVPARIQYKQNDVWKFHFLPTSSHKSKC